MDNVWLALDVLKAVKTNDLPVYVHCLYNMADLFFSFDGHNYARYLTFFSVFLANIEESHPGATELLKGGAISVARSMIPGNRCAVDKTIEETFMKHAKSHGGSGGCGAGLTGILTNFDAYQRWVKTTHERAQFVDVTYTKADMMSDTQGGEHHKDLRPAEVKKSEKRVIKAMESITSFLNPFDVPDADKLYCISSGVPATAEIERDLLSADTSGKHAKEVFITDRLVTKSNFFEPVKKMKLKTFEAANKTVRLKTTNNKIVTYKQHSSLALQLLVKSQPNINIEHLMTYPLSYVPCSLGTADGYMAKTDKSKGFHWLVKDIDDIPLPTEGRTLIIQDGNALFHTMHDIPANFQQIAHHIFDRIPKHSDFIFSTDMYKVGSIKEMERKLRGSSEKLIIKGPMTKKPPNWKTFLMNDDNKSQLADIIHRVWSSDISAPKLMNRKVMTVVQGHCFLLETEDGKAVKETEITDLFSDQEETDTRIVLYCVYAQDHGYDNIRIRSPDSDVFFVLLHHAGKLDVNILFDTGTGNKKRLINITQMAHGYGQQFCTALLGLHAFTHCDTTSAFKGIGKVRPIKLLQKSPQLVEALSQLGDMWDPPERLVDDLEEFTCAMYGRTHHKSVDAVRYAILSEKCGGPDGTINIDRNIDLGQFPPCRKSLYQHIRRVNYQTRIWKCADVALPVIPEPTDGHGWKSSNGKTTPLGFDGPVVAADVASEDDTTENDEDVTSDDDIELSDIDEYVMSSDSDDDSY